jgi:hypothetical protein
MGDAAFAVHDGFRDTESLFPEGVVPSTEVVSLSGTWLVIAGGGGGGGGDASTDEHPERRAAEQAAGVLGVPSVIRTALRSFDEAARTTFSRPAPQLPGPCTAEALGSAAMTRTTGLYAQLVVAVHDAACREDADWLVRYLTPAHFRNGRPFTLDAHATSGDPRQGIPFRALATALEAGPRPEPANRLVYAFEQWTFVFEARLNTLGGLVGMSDRCGTPGSEADPVCQAARGRGVVGLDWEPPGLAASCDGQPVETRQRLYLYGRNSNVPDVVVRSACRAPTGSWPTDVSVLDGSKSAASAVVLQNLIDTSKCMITSDAYEDEGNLAVPVPRNLCDDTWEDQTLRYRWDRTHYRLIA